jgi:predicted nucleic acid-binding protein
LIYLDSSCLVKVLRPESESSAVVDAIGREQLAVVSALAELEILVQLKAFHLAGDYTRPRWRQLEAHLAALRNQAPYEFRAVPASVFQTAFRQHRNSGNVHCRSLDRLHLAIMEELGISRLMTHDNRLAKAAESLSFEVVQPGRP